MNSFIDILRHRLKPATHRGYNQEQSHKGEVHRYYSCRGDTYGGFSHIFRLVKVPSIIVLRSTATIFNFSVVLLGRHHLRKLSLLVKSVVRVVIGLAIFSVISSCRVHMACYMLGVLLG